MKKIVCSVLYFFMCLGICFGVGANALTRIYYPDGSEKLVGKSLIQMETLRGGSLTPFLPETPEEKEPMVTMYAADGRTLEVVQSEVELYKTVGWYTEPVVIMYAADGRTLDVIQSEVELYKTVGWYTEPVVIMYAADGRTLDVIQSEVELYKTVGWYTEPVVIMYAEDGRTLDVIQSEVELYKTVGWYISPADFPRNQKMVALTFDDGPSKFTPQILDCLAAHNAKATFFVVGTNTNANPAIVKRASDMGMEIGNHTMHHKNLKTLSANGIRNELNSASSAILAACGKRPTLIRPPYGNYNSTVSSVADGPLILWSIDTLDWKTRNADKTVQSILSNVKDGSVILMHDLYSQTAEAAVRVIPELIARGYKLVTVSELAAAKGVNMQNGKNYSSFR